MLYSYSNLKQMIGGWSLPIRSIFHISCQIYTIYKFLLGYLKISIYKIYRVFTIQILMNFFLTNVIKMVIIKHSKA